VFCTSIALLDFNIIKSLFYFNLVTDWLMTKMYFGYIEDITDTIIISKLCLNNKFINPNMML